MAWVTEYDLKWISLTETGSIYLQRDGGTYQQGLKLRTGSLEIRKVLPDWESSIVRGNCSFTVINDLDNFFTLLPLMTISNGQIRVVVTNDSLPAIPSLFEGFLNCEIIDQDMLNKSDLHFTASGLLQKVNNDHPVEIDTLGNMSLFDVIDDCLLLTGSEYNIRVDCSLSELNSALAAGQTLFNRTALFTQILWKNNVDRLSGLEILETILKSFNCYLFWHQEYWYIQHYQDMGNTNASPYQKTYVEYTSGVSYEDADTGSTQVVTIGVPYDIHAPSARPQIGGSQVLSVIPGQKEIEIRKKQSQYFNLINGDLSGAVDNNDAFPIAANREWESCVTTGITGWYAKGYPWRNMANSTFRDGYGVATLNGYGNGLTTAFKITLQSDTMLTLQWKYGVLSKNIIPPAMGFADNWEDYTVTHYYWVNVIVPFVSSGFLVYGESAGEWQYGGATPLDAAQTVEKSGTDFDVDLLTMEVSVSIPIGEVLHGNLSSNEIIVNFGIGHEQFDDGSITPIPAALSYFGDIEASISETPDNNILKGTVNTAFLNKKTITLDLFDSGWSYRNILLRGSAFHLRAEEWGYDSVSDELARWLLAAKFRLYNVARQRIKIKYRSTDLFMPLGLWRDNKQSDKLFVLFSDIHYPENGEHIVELHEYDDSTEINLV